MNKTSMKPTAELTEKDKKYYRNWKLFNSVVYGIILAAIIVGLLGVREATEFIKLLLPVAFIVAPLIWYFQNRNWEKFISDLQDYEARVNERPLTRGIVVGYQVKNEDELNRVENAIKKGLEKAS